MPAWPSCRTSSPGSARGACRSPSAATSTSDRWRSALVRTPPPERGCLRLFVYGTLIDEWRLEALTGRRFPRRPATLDGFARRALRAGYPTVERSSDARVDGFLVEDVDPASGPAAAGEDLDGCRTVGRRRAARDRAHERVVEPEPVVAVPRRRLVREAGAMQRGVEPVPALVAGEDAARTVPAVGGRGEP